MIPLEREYKTQKIPDKWFVDSIKRGNITTKEIIDDLNINKDTAYYRLRELESKGLIMKDTKRMPFYYYVNEQT